MEKNSGKSIPHFVDSLGFSYSWAKTKLTFGLRTAAANAQSKGVDPFVGKKIKEYNGIKNTWCIKAKR